jgi:hypothetical protein
MLGLFGWIRRRAAEAVLSGVADACDAIDAGDNGGPVLTLPVSLARRLTAALPAAEARQDAEGDGSALVPTASRNGRKAK